MFRGWTHVDCMLIRLDHMAEHLSRLQTFLIHQLVTDDKKLREGVLDDLVEIRPLLPRLESVDTADGQQTLKPREDRVGVIGAQQSQGDVHKPRPLLWKVMLEDLLEDGN